MEPKDLKPGMWFRFNTIYPAHQLVYTPRPNVNYVYYAREVNFKANETDKSKIEVIVYYKCYLNFKQVNLASRMLLFLSEDTDWFKNAIRLLDEEEIAMHLLLTQPCKDIDES